MAQTEIVQTMKLHLHTDKAAAALFLEAARTYAAACNVVSQYVFDHEFITGITVLHKALYRQIREQFGLKSQMAQSTFRTVAARYKTVETLLEAKPWRYQDENGKSYKFTRTLEWMWRPIQFRRPQIDLVRNKDYSFVKGGLSVNTLKGRVVVSYDKPDCFDRYFNDGWTFGTAKLVSLLGEWYLHISMTKKITDTMDESHPTHLVGLDRGLRFLITAYNEQGDTEFVDGKEILAKRARFHQVRAELQSKGTKSAKRALKRISGRENRWMTDVNHQKSKALVLKYGAGTLFVIEDLAGVSFSEELLSRRNAKGRNELRSWAFYQFEQFLSYKAQAAGSAVVKVDAAYTSQRCPKCGRIRKANRNHEKHEYRCDVCHYRSNDDRVGAMNIYELGRRYAAGEPAPGFKRR